ncbi:MAG TPA: hypothetical protein VJQ55_10030 [Candidatus Binatia bacterium]|nr:hypothetical protein [Candidatus Binatia bacterium]
MLAAKQTSRPAVKLPPNFRQIRLELAREKGHPAGSAAHGYTIFAPLDKDSKIDPQLWHAFRDFCRVVRFRPDEEEAIGHVIHRPGGSWAFHYDIRGAEDDESGYHLENERFEPGEYVSIREHDRMHTFQVMSVERI